MEVQLQGGGQKLQEEVKHMKQNISLQKIVNEGVKLLKNEEGLIEGRVFAYEGKTTVGRIVFTTHIPSSGLLEPKSSEGKGVYVEIWFEKNGKKLIGSGQEPSEISIAAIKRALVKAKRDAVDDPDFFGFLKKVDIPTHKSYSTKKLTKTKSVSPTKEADVLSKMGWDAIKGATSGLKKYTGENQFILNGDVSIVMGKMATANTNGVSAADDHGFVSSYLTAMLEDKWAKGTSWDIKEIDKSFNTLKIGKEAALAAIANKGGIRISSGKYNVIFGHQAMADLFAGLLLSHVNLGMIDFGASMFVGKYGEKVASEDLQFYDDPTIKSIDGGRAFTDEGYPTSKTKLIENGVLVGYLSDIRTTNKVLHKKDAKQFLGVDPREIKKAILPKNGSIHGISGTNVVVDSKNPISTNKLLRKVDNGIFIGRLWYTYPIGGYASGIITGTAVADSYLIKNGKLRESLLPNTIRLEDNLGQMIKNIIGIANNKRPIITWNTDEITYAPWVAMKEVQLMEINKGDRM